MTKPAKKLDFYFYSDQPTTCPKCGSRTNILLDLAHTKMQTQVHVCCDRSCRFEFIVTN